MNSRKKDFISRLKEINIITVYDCFVQSVINFYVRKKAYNTNRTPACYVREALVAITGLDMAVLQV
jgi:hypothetical protein